MSALESIEHHKYLKFRALPILMQTLFKKMQTMPDLVCRVFSSHEFPTQNLLGLFLCVLLPLANAAVVDNLYAVEIPVVDQNANTRNGAFKHGLKEVLIRVTGDRNIFSMIKLPRASSYVKQYQYHELEKVNKTPLAESAERLLPKKKQEPTKLLWVQFNETKVNEFVRSNALPLWSKHRNETVIWIAVNDGINRYVLKKLDESLLKTVTSKSAIRRGVPVVWPEVSRDEQAIRFADVWAGFQRPLKQLSSEYSNGPIIIGRLHWDGEQWNSDWSLLLEENKTSWVIEHVDYKKLLADAIDTAADAMGQQFALFDTGNVKSYHSLGIQVDNVNSIVALNGVKQYLSSVPSIQQFALERVDNHRVFFELSILTNIEDFLDTLQGDSKLLLVPEERQSKDELKPDFKSDIAQTDLAQSDATSSISKAADYQFQFQP